MSRESSMVRGLRVEVGASVNDLVNPYIDEVSIGDFLAGELGIAILDAKRGLWRFRDEEALRSSAEPP